MAIRDDVAATISKAYREQFAQLEAENNLIRQEFADIREAWRKIRQERTTEVVKRPKPHQHTTDDINPVLVFDLDGTLKPGAKGVFPMDGIDPFPGVKEVLDGFANEGCCLHLQTAGLFTATQDMEVYHARHGLIANWIAQHGLPIDLLLPNVPADCYYDDRMVPVDANNADWSAVADQARQMLSKKFKLEDGKWVRKPKTYKGKLMTDWPKPEEVPGDSPRAFNGPRLDADLHRTVFDSSSSERWGKPMPGAKHVLQSLYDQKVTINLSCAGWNPAFRTPDESKRRLAGLRVQLRAAGIPYDRLVTKDHGDLFFNDKGVTCTGDWEKDFPLIEKKLKGVQRLRIAI